MDLVCQGHHLSMRVIERGPLQVYDLGWSVWRHGNGSITMLMVLALGLACQHLELDRQVVEPEQEVEVRAMDSAGEAIADLPVDVVLPDGNLRSLGATAADGFLQFRSSQLGQHELRAQLPLGGALLVTSFQVVDRPPVWLYALVCIPLGLSLLYLNVRRMQRWRRNSQTPRSEPSPPAP